MRWGVCKHVEDEGVMMRCLNVFFLAMVVSTVPAAAEPVLKFADESKTAGLSSMWRRFCRRLQCPAATRHRVRCRATSGASILSSTTRADGFIIVPADSEGYPADTLVRVWLYDRPYEHGLT